MNFNHPFQKNNREEKPCEQKQVLSKSTMSPNRRQPLNQTFQQYRCKSNILYDFESYILYNKLLGEGAFSRVYLGEAKRTKKMVAIKQVQKLEENEIACLMNSESPYIIRLYDFWNFDKFSYIALQLCDGNLREELGKLAKEEKINYFQQIVQGINYLYKKNIIHRDLKFQNILLKNNTIKISDFGFAKPIGSKLAVFSQKCGTPYTMAPQIYFHNGQGKPIYTHKCDIYSLGVILHQMLYDRHPYDYSTQKMKNNHRVRVLKKFGVLDVLIDRCLEQQVARRCNWSEFMQIFTLFMMKRPHENVEALKEKNKNHFENRNQQIKNLKKPETNLLKYKKNIYQTPVRNQAKKENFLHQQQNPFHRIRLPNRKNDFKAEQKKPVRDIPKGLDSQSDLIQHKLKEQAWKIEHDNYFENFPQKKNSMENETVSAVKIVFLVIAALTFMVLLQSEFK